MNNVIQMIEMYVTSLSNEEKIEDNGICINNTKYLLGQILRAYNVPNDHFFVSKEAKNLWEQLTSENIDSFSYREKVKCDRANGLSVNTYIGASKKGKQFIVNKNDNIVYRDVFHNEHIVPIYDIIEMLKNLHKSNQLTEQNIIGVLDKIYICRITKNEDRMLSRKRSRTEKLDYQDAIRNFYDKAGIKVLNADGKTI